MKYKVESTTIEYNPDFTTKNITNEYTTVEEIEYVTEFIEDILFKNKKLNTTFDIMIKTSK